jgi:hypothetical protein
VAPTAAEVEPGARALGLGSEIGAQTISFRPLSAENRPAKLGEHLPSLRRGVAPAAVEVDPEAGALGLGSEKGALTKGFRPFSADCKNIRRDRASAFARRGARRVPLRCSAVALR